MNRVIIERNNLVRVQFFILHVYLYLSSFINLVYLFRLSIPLKKPTP